MINQYTDSTQNSVLESLGIKVKDIGDVVVTKGGFAFWKGYRSIPEHDMGRYSLSAGKLISLMPRTVFLSSYTMTFFIEPYTDGKSWRVGYKTENGIRNDSVLGDDLVGCLVRLLVKLKREELL